MFGFSEPLLTLMVYGSSSTYAELFESAEDEDNHNEVHTWSHGAGNQSLPTYSGVNEVSYSDNWVYIRTTGLGHHIMGPWYRDRLDTNYLEIFLQISSTQFIGFQCTPSGVSSDYNITTGGAIGYFIDGVGCSFDARDAFSYINNLGIDGTH